MCRASVRWIDEGCKTRLRGHVRRPASEGENRPSPGENRPRQLRRERTPPDRCVLPRKKRILVWPTSLGRSD
jgi:hypothetical protein